MLSALIGLLDSTRLIRIPWFRLTSATSYKQLVLEKVVWPIHQDSHRCCLATVGNDCHHLLIPQTMVCNSVPARRRAATVEASIGPFWQDAVTLLLHRLEGSGWSSYQSGTP